MPGLRPHRFRRASGGRTASGRKIRQPCSQLGNSVIVPKGNDWTNAIPAVQRHVTGQWHGVRRQATCAEKPRMHKTTAEKPRMHKTNRIWVLSLPRYGVPGPISMHCCCSDPAVCQSSEFGFYLWPMFRARAHINPQLLLLRQKVLIQLLL